MGGNEMKNSTYQSFEWNNRIELNGKKKKLETTLKKQTAQKKQKESFLDSMFVDIFFMLIFISLLVYVHIQKSFWLFNTKYLRFEWKTNQQQGRRNHNKTFSKLCIYNSNQLVF